LIGVFAGCGTIDERANYVGTWSYLAGSTFAITCPGQPPMTLDLTHAPPDGQPAHFVLTKAADPTHVHELDGLGCNFDWAVSGATATLDPPNQACDKFPDGHGGTFTITTTSGTKSISDGKSMSVAIHGAFGQCTSLVSGSSTRQ
jgi:hypothetical protein